MIEILPKGSKILLVMTDGAILVVDVLDERNAGVLLTHAEIPICSADVRKYRH